MRRIPAGNRRLGCDSTRRPSAASCSAHSTRPTTDGSRSRRSIESWNSCRTAWKGASGATSVRQTVLERRRQQSETGLLQVALDVAFRVRPPEAIADYLYGALPGPTPAVIQVAGNLSLARSAHHRAGSRTDFGVQRRPGRRAPETPRPADRDRRSRLPRRATGSRPALPERALEARLLPQRLVAATARRTSVRERTDRAPRDAGEADLAPRSIRASAAAGLNPEPVRLDDPQHVCLERQHVLAEREPADRLGRVAANAGQLCQVVRPTPLGHKTRCPMQADGAAVVAEPLPRANHVVQTGRQRLGHRRPPPPSRPRTAKTTRATCVCWSITSEYETAVRDRGGVATEGLRGALGAGQSGARIPDQPGTSRTDARGARRGPRLYGRAVGYSRRPARPPRSSSRPRLWCRRCFQVLAHGARREPEELRGSRRWSCRAPTHAKDLSLPRRQSGLRVTFRLEQSASMVRRIVSRASPPDSDERFVFAAWSQSTSYGGSPEPKEGTQ